MRGIFTFAVLAGACLGAAASAKPFKTSSKFALLEFEYGWSSEANAIPALAKRFSAAMNKEKAHFLAMAKSDAAQRSKQDFPFNPYSVVTNITTAGQTPRFLSLQIDHYAYTGGAHGNGAATALLWDRRLGHEVKFATLFRSRSGENGALRAPYCKALDDERKKRRGGDGKLNGGVSEFDACPAIADLAQIPADTNRNGRFDKVQLIAAPYLAGPYVEGEYAISLPATRQLIAAISPGYRSSFEVQRQ